jgi:hypothetical protein
LKYFSQKQNLLLQSIVVVLLGLVALCVVMAIRSSSNAAHSMGPQALGIVGDRVWIADELGLFITDAHGEIQLQRTHADLGVKSISGIAMVDAQHALIASRDSTTIKLVSAIDCSLLRDIHLQLPADLDNMGSAMLWIAAHPIDSSGHFEIAAATGGNHTVVRFNDDGRLLARTKAGLFRFTNGLWYADGGLWTTDTNRYYLRKLDTDTLAQTDEIALHADHAKRYLGAAAASNGEVMPNGMQPLATLARLDNQMKTGRVVDLFRDGSELEFPLSDDAEPMDIGWIGKELLVVDGATGNVKRFDSLRQPLGEFGGAALRRHFHESHHERQISKRIYFLWLALAVACFLTALLLLMLARRVSPAERSAQPALPMAGILTIMRLAFTALWPHCLLIASISQAGTLMLKATKWMTPLLGKEHSVWLVLSLMTVTFVIFAVWAGRRGQRLANGPAYEPLLNHGALYWLHTSRHWRTVCRTDETPREVISCFAPKVGILLLTNQRLIFSRRGLSTDTADASWEYAEIVSAGIDEFNDVKWWWRIKRSLMGIRIDIVLRDNEHIRFNVRSIFTARRIVDSLTHNKESSFNPNMQSVPATRLSEIGSASQQAFASAVVPGLGQWMQRRNYKAAAFFVYAVVVLLFLVLPIAWALITKHTEVHASVIQSAVTIWVLLCSISALEAWFMRRRWRN